MIASELHFLTVSHGVPRLTSTTRLPLSIHTRRADSNCHNTWPAPARSTLDPKSSEDSTAPPVRG